MHEAGAAPTVDRFDALVSAYKKGEKWLELDRVMRLMVEAGLKPRMDSYDLLINAFEQQAQVSFSQCCLYRLLPPHPFSDTPWSREISTKVGVDKRLEKHCCKGGVQQHQSTFMGVDHDALSVCVSGAYQYQPPMNVIWRCQPPFTTMLGAYQPP